MSSGHGEPAAQWLESPSQTVLTSPATAERPAVLRWDWLALGHYAAVVKLLVVVLLALFFIQPGPISGPATLPTTGSTPLRSGQVVTQSFRGSYPDLYRVDLHIASVPPGINRELTFELRALDTGEEIYSAVFPVTHAGDLTFELEPIAESRGRLFEIELRSQGSSEEDSPTVGLSPRRGETHAPVRLSGQQIPESLSYRVYYRATLGQQLGTTFERLAAQQRGPLSWPAIYWLVLTAYLAVCAALAYVAVGRSK
ncbi:MAG: hypothetical protein HY329_24390 [Chloroflexi bacterium]|nr:hypothetical protein [Chloroflexota bacterium]